MMISRHNGFGLSVAVSLASAYLTLNTPALAQDTVPSSDTPPADVPVDSSLAASASTEVATPAPAESAPAVQTSVAVEATTETKPEVAIPAAPPAPAAAAAPESVTLAIIELPGSAYPSLQTRGITYGSLWRTFHGQQWPYMPQVGNQPSLQLGFSGGFWSDLSNTQIRPDPQLDPQGYHKLNRWNSQARGSLRLTPTYNAGEGWFAQGNAELVIQGDMAPPAGGGVIGTTDDLWIRVGKWNVFDVTIGRFQGWEIANHYGMALDQNTLERSGALLVGGSGAVPNPTDGYGLTYFWERQNYLLGSYAAHIYPTDYLRAEILGHIGAGSSSYASTPNQMDIRPSVIFDVGFLKLKGGWEYGIAESQDANLKGRESKNGFGFAAQAVFAPYVEFGANFARGFRDVVDKEEQVDLESSNTVQTVGGFLNASPGYEPLVFGFGAYLSHDENMRVDKKVGEHFNEVDVNDQWLLFGTVQYTVWSHLYIKLVLSNASNKGESYKLPTYVNNAMSGRLRVEFLF